VLRGTKLLRPMINIVIIRILEGDKVDQIHQHKIVRMLSKVASHIHIGLDIRSRDIMTWTIERYQSIMIGDSMKDFMLY